MKIIAILGASILLLILAVPVLGGGNHNQPPCPGNGLAATYPTPCVTPTPTPTPTPSPTPEASPTPGSNCEVRDPRPGTCSQPDPSPTPSPVPTPTPAATPSPTPDATPERPPEITPPPTDGTASPVSPLNESPPLFLWLIAALAVLFLVATPSRRRTARWQDWPYQARRFMAREVRR